MISHTRTSTDCGPDSDYCLECSDAAQDWVKWPCPAADGPRCTVIIGEQHGEQVACGAIEAVHGDALGKVNHTFQP